jgi:hypothetical protein
MVDLSFLEPVALVVVGTMFIVPVMPPAPGSLHWLMDLKSFACGLRALRKAIEDTDPGNAQSLRHTDIPLHTHRYHSLPFHSVFTDHTQPTAKTGSTDAALNTYTPEKFAEVPLSQHLPPPRCTMRRITRDRTSKTEKKPH